MSASGQMDPTIDLSDDPRAARRALLRLPPRERAAVLLRLVERLSERDVAALLGCRIETVRSMVGHGLRTFRAELDRDQRRSADRARIAVTGATGRASG